MIIAITELKINSLWHLPRAVFLSTKAYKEASTAPGNLAVKTNNQGLFVWRTITAWHNLDTMKNYVRMPFHAKAMKFAAKSASKVKVLHLEAHEIPTWPKAIEMLKSSI